MSDPSGLVPIDNELDDQFGREKRNTGKYKKRAPTRTLYGDSHRAGSSKGDITVGSKIGGDNQEVRTVCVTGFGCLDQYAVTNIADYVDKYNAQVAARSQGNGGQPLQDFQYLEAMVAACAANSKELEANCSGQAYITLNTAYADASVAAYEQANGIPAWKSAAAAGGTVLEAALGAVGSASAARSGSSCMMPTLMAGGRRSFSADTPVLLGDGKTTKNLKDIKAGDEVLASDPETGEQGSRKVIQVWIHQDDLYTLSVDGKQLTVTEDHPIWDATDHRWKRADELERGDWLRTPTGEGAYVDRFQRGTHKIATAYNLTVEDLHTYYVVVGGSPVLVHNGCGEEDVVDQTLGPKGPAEGVSAERGDKVLGHEQEMINEFGDRNGCSTCPATTSGYRDGHWTGDHQPPNKLAPDGPWTLYPQCKACTLRQGGVVNGIKQEWYKFDE